jgi:hypothetical protein
MSENIYEHYSYNFDDSDIVQTSILALLLFSHLNTIMKYNICEDLLNTQKYESLTDQEINDNKSCVICFEEYKGDNIISKIICKHIFHTKCLNMWIEKNQSCPLCRQEI